MKFTKNKNIFIFLICLSTKILILAVYFNIQNLNCKFLYKKQVIFD